MAARITSTFIEVGVVASAAPKIRNTSEFIEVGVRPSTSPKIRITSTFIEIGVRGAQFVLTDSINNWSDSVSTALELGGLLVLNVADTLGNLADAVGTFIDIPNKTIDVQDSLYVWADEVDSNPYFGIQAFDTMQYNWADSIALTYPLAGLSLGDTLNNWKDNTNQYITAFGTSTSDTLLLADQIKLQLAYLVEVSDDINNLSDNLTSEFGNRDIVIGDIFQLLDYATVILTEFLNISVGDDLNNWSDSTPMPEFEELETSYLRRYLNDVRGR